MSSNVSLNSNQDYYNTIEFYKDTSKGLSFESSEQVAQTFVDEANIFANYYNLKNNETSVDFNTAKAFMQVVFGEQILDYYTNNGVEYEDVNQVKRSLANTVHEIAYSLDLDTSGDITKEEIMAALDFAQNIEDNKNITTKEAVSAISSSNKDGQIHPNDISGELSEEDAQKLLNFLTTGDTSFNKYNEDEYDEALIEAMTQYGSFEHALESINPIAYAQEVGAKYREGEQLSDKDYDAIIKLIDSNRLASIIHDELK